ncbi:MAG: Stk1 family PASTA domain-containing Ser/Thr kinase [Nocardioidaceae bacterium]|nr:Stk1 family PASTA domain-containing Ser/Thr kinase [Nocardioidaceae bacterium]
MNTPEPPVVGGRYQLGELLGRGGMAEVRKGVDLRLGRAVAVKRLRTDLASDATFQARFRREAQSSAALNHPAIVAVYDTGEEMATDGSDVAQPYIVMEFVEGRTLRDILREGRKILPERALEITSSVLGALDYSHRAGIIHRDIKPGNVMLTPTGDVKVMDFGIARAVSDSASTMTQTAAVVGTAQYLSPEQARGETVDSRSDVYSAGCLLYELLTGRPPFIGDSPVAVAYQHVREIAQPPSDHDTELPPEVDSIVMKALAKRVEDRYQSAAAMRNDIERYLGGRPVMAPAVPVAPVTTMLPEYDPSPATATAIAAVEDPPEERKKSRAGWWIAAVLLLAALAAASAFIVPKLLDSSPQEVQVPNLEGKTEQQASAALQNVNLKLGDVTEEASEDVKKGLVLSQDPVKDDYVAPGSSVDIVVSSGKPTVQMPPVVGMTRQAATRVLEGAPYNFVVIAKETEADDPQGQIVETAPKAGKDLTEGATVTIYYSDGPEQVPNVVGKSEDVARQLIEAAGFTVKVIYDDSPTDQATGTVLEQNPPADAPAQQKSQVVIIVTTYVAPSESPSPSATDSGSPSATPSP